MNADSRDSGIMSEKGNVMTQEECQYCDGGVITCPDCDGQCCDDETCFACNGQGWIEVEK